MNQICAECTRFLYSDRLMISPSDEQNAIFRLTDAAFQSVPLHGAQRWRTSIGLSHSREQKPRSVDILLNC
jgi:hypothetical protein